MVGAENRLELFLVELREERIRLFNVILLGCVAAMLGFMTLLTITFTVVVIFWDSARVPVLASLSAIYFLATIGILWRLKARLQNWVSFPSTLAELKKDRSCLEEKN
ncbi:MAG TPA: phage holin family protein [Candidatus Paceibacterota bacterium]|nr:phage holin family protein [Candidatus Paceibacterota bacterium]